MSVPVEFAKQFAKFPECLRKLVEAEIADGNTIVEICGGFPAAPCGDCLRLAKPVAASRRESRDDVDFYERNSSDYFGEFTDAKRHFFVLEPPKPPEPEPDMNAIRAEKEARERAADAERLGLEEAVLTAARHRALEVSADAVAKARRIAKPKRTESSQDKSPDMDAIRAGMEARERAANADRFGLETAEWEASHQAVARTEGESRKPAASAKPTGAVARFAASMQGSLESWREGTGYDLGLLKSATPEELAEIEAMLLSRPVDDWRDVEALAAFDSPRARALLKKALKSDNHRVATAVAQYAPDLVSKSERTKTLVAALEGAEIYGGLTQTLLQVEEFHPPKVIEALFRGALTRDGSTAVHLAAMLMFVHGKAESSFDWKHRPLFLRFNTEDRAERESAFRDLCEKIGVRADSWLSGF